MHALEIGKMVLLNALIVYIKKLIERSHTLFMVLGMKEPVLERPLHHHLGISS